MKDLTLLIPAKDEAESLPIILQKIKKKKYKINIIINKNDYKTINAIKKYKVKLVYTKDGYGNALKKGIKSIKTKYLLIFNADGSMDHKEIPQMFKAIKKRNDDLIFASRYLSKESGSMDDSMLTYIGNKIFTFFGKIFFGTNITDILFTFIIGKTLLFKKLKLKCNDFTICVEIPINAKRKNYKYSDISSFELSRIAGTKKVNEIKDGFLILMYMIRRFLIN
ncbi:glycosyltransferase [Candidatus Pelagibacter sp.]|nr:glycosyltransferase [Candidatus Pelagibacter sp.]